MAPIAGTAPSESAPLFLLPAAADFLSEKIIDHPRRPRDLRRQRSSMTVAAMSASADRGHAVDRCSHCGQNATHQHKQNEFT
jgi:hypothetical protein